MHQTNTLLKVLILHIFIFKIQKIEGEEKKERTIKMIAIIDKKKKTNKKITILTQNHKVHKSILKVA